MSLNLLKSKYPFPKEKPNRKFDPRGWFDKSAEEVLFKFLNNTSKLIVELGSFLGKSTRYMLDIAPNATLISIDHWKASYKWFDNKIDRDKFESYIYETFLFNCWEYKDRLIPIKRDTISGLEEVAENKLEPDLIYVDADHYFEGVIKDLYKSAILFPRAIIVGDDWNWGKEDYPVRRAAKLIAKEFKFKLNIMGNTWWFTKPAF